MGSFRGYRGAADAHRIATLGVFPEQPLIADRLSVPRPGRFTADLRTAGGRPSILAEPKPGFVALRLMDMKRNIHRTLDELCGYGCASTVAPPGSLQPYRFSYESDRQFAARLNATVFPRVIVMSALSDRQSIWQHLQVD
jgi:hypothetical protein